MKICALFLFLIVNHSVQAEPVNLIALSTDAQPGKTAYLGLNTDSNHLIGGFFYKSNKGTLVEYTVAELAQPQVLLSKNGFDLVTLSISSSTATTAVLNFNYNKDVFDTDMGIRSFSVKLNDQSNAYEIFDEEQRQFSRANVIVHRNFLGFPTGIEEIQLQQ